MLSQSLSENTNDDVMSACRSGTNVTLDFIGCGTSDITRSSTNRDCVIRCGEVKPSARYRENSVINDGTSKD